MSTQNTGLFFRQNQLSLKWSDEARKMHPAVVSSPRRAERDLLLEQYRDKLCTDNQLSRLTVSSQAGKDLPFYRWFRYKEAFSKDFVLAVLSEIAGDRPHHRHILDPFAGTGTALFTAAEAGWDTVGIELMPVALAVCEGRQEIERVRMSTLRRHANELIDSCAGRQRKRSTFFRHVRITAGAFPETTEGQLAGCLDFLARVRSRSSAAILRLALMSVLEEVSYTRKDGQYLRWDHRARRDLKSKFEKPKVTKLRDALSSRLSMVMQDVVEIKQHCPLIGDVALIGDSCFQALPQLPDSQFDLIITSPPYCNRYDYTRTYALELAFLGFDDEAIKTVRQELLSATVENRPKQDILKQQYGERDGSDKFERRLAIFQEQKALQEVLGVLQEAASLDLLNNPNVPNMVRNYFFEMNIVIQELTRVLKPGGHIVMVNDNVQYHGEEIPVDLILSDFAQKGGLTVDRIFVLPNGKGNSSQQMALHGRKELRKCVYVWSKG